jgi:hypothetical protein
VQRSLFAERNRFGAVWYAFQGRLGVHWTHPRMQAHYLKEAARKPSLARRLFDAVREGVAAAREAGEQPCSLENQVQIAWHYLAGTETLSLLTRRLPQPHDRRPSGTFTLDPNRDNPRAGGPGARVAARNKLPLEDLERDEIQRLQNGVEGLLLPRGSKKKWSHFCQADALLVKLGGADLALRQPSHYAKRLRKAIRQLREDARQALRKIKAGHGPQACAPVLPLQEVLEWLEQFYRTYDGSRGGIAIPGWPTAPASSAVEQWDGLVRQLKQLPAPVRNELEGLLSHFRDGPGHTYGAAVRFALDLACEASYWDDPRRLRNRHLCATDGTLRNHDHRRLAVERKVFEDKAEYWLAALQRTWRDVEPVLGVGAAEVPQAVRDFIGRVNDQLRDLTWAFAVNRHGRHGDPEQVRKKLEAARKRLPLLTAAVKPVTSAVEARGGGIGSALERLLTACTKATHNVLDFVTAFALARRRGGLALLLPAHRAEPEWLNDTLEPVPGRRGSDVPRPSRG